MLIPIAELTGQAILAGAGPGRVLLSQLTSISPSAGDVIYLDFRDVEVATASFLREGVVAYRDFIRSRYPSRSVVVANASERVLEELEFFLSHRRDAMWACNLEDGRHTTARVIGELDDTQWRTLKSVSELGTASAPELAVLHQGESTIGTTAWNNRLQSLASKGLLLEGRVGKSKHFRPVLEASGGR